MDDEHDSEVDETSGLMASTQVEFAPSRPSALSQDGRNKQNSRSPSYGTQVSVGSRIACCK